MKKINKRKALTRIFAIFPAFLLDNGSEKTLFEGSQTATVVMKPLLLYTQSLTKEYEDVTVSSFRAQFDAAVMGVSLYESNHNLTLLSQDLSFGSFFVEKGKKTTLVIKVAWGGTVTRDFDTQTDTMSLPAFKVELE